MKKSLIIAISILIALLGMTDAVRDAWALDAPHNTNDPAWSITCSRCHYSPTGPTPTWASLPTTTDETFKNNLCTSCHSSTGMPLADPRYTNIRTHSADVTLSTKWGGAWTNECTACHSPHYQQQATNAAFVTDPTSSVVVGTTTSISVSGPTASMSSLTDSTQIFTPNQWVGYLLTPNVAYPTRVYRITSNDNTTLNVDGAININYAGAGRTYTIRYGKMVNANVITWNSGIAPVKFFSNTDFVTTGAPYTGVCQVCHTITHSYTNTGTLSDPTRHSDDPQQAPGGRCGDCHMHQDGFKPPVGSCVDCHGNPPTSLSTLIHQSANSPDPLRQTNATSAGAHWAHVSTQGLACSKCHYMGMPTTTLDTRIEMGFDPTLGTGNSTYYTRGTLSNGYTYTSKTIKTTLVTATTNSMKTNCTTYCHSDVQANGGNAGPTTYATVTWTMTAANVPCGSCHRATATLLTTGSHTKHLSTAGGYPAGTCNDCHSGNIHANGFLEVNNSYGQGASSPTGTGGYATCFAALCHEDGRLALVETPVWGTPSAKCSVCHDVRPVSLGHAAHLTTGSAVYVAKCQDCHNGYLEGSTLNAAQHLDDNIDVYRNTQGDLGYPANTTRCNTDTFSCSSLYCHQDGRGNIVTSPLWGDNTVPNCTHCHGVVPSTGSHAAHVVSSQMHLPVCGDCHNGAVQTVSAASGTNHLDGYVDVYTATPGDLGYPVNKSIGSAFTKCTNAYCHSSGQSLNGASATPYTIASPTWGSAATGSCGTCHPVIVPISAQTISSGSHTVHLLLSPFVGCEDCHAGATSATYDATIHADGQIDVGLGSYTAGTVRGNGYGRCSTASCHDNGLNVSTLTPTWGNHVADCSQCHAIQPTTGSHTWHLVSTPATHSLCGDCHNGAVQGTTYSAQHLDGNVDVYKTTPGDLGYPANKTKNTVFARCSTVYCHSSGQGYSATSATPYSYGSPTWGNAASGACGTCHPVIAPFTSTTISSGSHTIHLSTATAGARATCGDCHSGAGTGTSYPSTNHVNQQINVTVSYTAGTTAGNGFGACNTNLCHGTTSRTWGNNTSTASCTKCHGQSGTSVASYVLNMAAPGYTSTGTNTGVDTGGLSLPTGTKVGTHNAHLTTSAYRLPLPCTSCHRVPTNVTDAGHIDSVLPAEVTGAYSALTNSHGAALQYNAGTATCTNLYCHDGAYFKNGGLWSNGTDTSPTWNNTALLSSTPTTTADCNKCHGYPPNPTLHPNDANCLSCHSHVTTGNLGFRAQGSPGIELHVNGFLESSGGDNCTDCHGALMSSGSHDQHTALNNLNGRTLSGGSYGTGTWWFGYSNTGGVPNASCGYCHPSSTSTHRNGTRELYFAPTDTNTNIAGSLKARNAVASNFTQTTSVYVTCSSTYCHSNGYSPSGNGLTNHDYTYQTSPEWFVGTFAGDTCANCHGNSPTGSTAHAQHRVAPHYAELFTGSVGTMISGTTGTNNHGNSAYSTTINCNVCHNLTVATGSYNNDLNTVCATCHNGTQATLRGTMVVAGTSTHHVDGAPDISFAAVNMKVKAQVRDSITSIAELNSTWTRSGTYKANGGFDQSNSLLTTGTYSSTTRGCSAIVCHNGYNAIWTGGALGCTACHTNVPQ